ncbi:uncharacterized protein LOC135845188 [Planococcus citri]|uniref:uncharacterized protein LOC135845188 n=1 Tax=Planococcus citri TaxID=170843 RepID=UPI0031F8C95C
MSGNDHTFTRLANINLQDDEDAELERVQYPMYKSCFDVVEKKVYHVKYKLRSRNFIYNLKSSEIYTEEQYEMILQREREFLIEMALNFDGMPKMKRSEFEENDDEEDSPEETVPKLTILQSVLAFDFSQKKNEESYLIPFQLVSHEDVILYNWKVATFHEKNYSLIWSNVADNAWGKINWYLRDLMTRGDCDIDVYSGVHDYGKDGYPYYLWKFVRSNLKGIVIVIHNHPRGDKKDYGHLCKKYIDVSCERYGFPANEKEKDRGLTYCCPTSAVRNELPFFKDRFVELQPLESGHLCDRSQINPPYRPKYEKKLYSSFKSLPSTSTNVPYERISSLESSVHDPTPSKLNSTAGSPNTSSEIEGEREDVVDHQNARLTPSMERILEMIQSRMMEAGVDPTFYGPNPPRPGTALVATTPSQTTPGQTTPNQTTPGQTTPSQTGSDIDDGPDAVKTSSGWTSSMERNYEMVRNALVNKSWGRTSTNKSWGRTSSMVSSADSTTSAIPVEAN